MTDYLTRLVERTLGVAPAVRPESPHTFATGMGDPSYLTPNTGPTRYPPQEESTPLPQPDGGPEPGEREDDSLSTTRDTARGDDPQDADKAQRSPRDSAGSRPGPTPPDAALIAEKERIVGPSGNEALPVEPPADLSAPGDRPAKREAEEGVEVERRLAETGRDDYSPEHGQRPAPVSPEAGAPERAGRDPVLAPDEPATGSTTSDPHPTERAGARHGESHASTSPDTPPPRDGVAMPDTRVRAVPPTDPGSDRRTTPLEERPLAYHPRASRTLRQEKHLRGAEISASETRERPPAAPGRAPLVPEVRAQTPEVPPVSADTPEATQPAAVPRRRAVAEETSSPTIRITIGRVEVRAVTPDPPPEPAQPSPAARPEMGLSLEDYLRQHNGGRR